MPPNPQVSNLLREYGDVASVLRRTTNGFVRPHERRADSGRRVDIAVEVVAVI